MAAWRDGRRDGEELDPEGAAWVLLSEPYRDPYALVAAPEDREVLQLVAVDVVRVVQVTRNVSVPPFRLMSPCCRRSSSAR
jgi:hypothetical protein